jgi:hypothetical protein
VLEFDFPNPRLIQEIDLDYWRVDLQMSVTVAGESGGQTKTFKEIYRNHEDYPHVVFALPDGPILVRSLRIELLDINAKDRAKIHIPGLELH